MASLGSVHDERVDVVVVGAGAAGLACAQALLTTGRSVTVLEARDRLGGRILSWPTADDDGVEIGAQVVHHTADPVLTDLLTWAQLELIPLPTEAALFVIQDGHRRSAIDIGRHQPPAPWLVHDLFQSAPGTLAEAMADLPAPARTAALGWWEQVTGGPPDELEAAGVALAIDSRSQGETEIRGGFAGLIAVLGAGVDVRLGQPVRSIEHDVEGAAVQVRTASSSFRAGAVVVTVPPGAVVRQNMSFEPGLGQQRLADATTLASGDGMVIVMSLQRAVEHGQWTLLLDPPGGLWRSRNGSSTVVGHVKGGAAPAARRFDFTRQAADVLALVAPGAAGVAAVRSYDWGADRWAAGTYSLPRPGSDAAAASWREPLGGRVFFAGEATATAALRGLVQGALSSGYRAAREVVAAGLSQPHVAPN